MKFMKKLVCCFAFVLMLVFAASGQALPVGNWYGDSVCQVKNSPCNTEKVVYRIIQTDETKFLTQADKIVNERAEFMGTIEFEFDAGVKILTNTTTTGKYKGAVWKFAIKDKEMEGTLTLADGTLYRRIKVAKAACGGKSYDN
jgi:hypothetical protein